MLGKVGVDYIFVALVYEVEEVFEFWKVGIDIMIMGILYDNDIEWAIVYDIEFYVFNYEWLKLVLEKVKKLNCKVKVYIEVEMGINCIGMIEEYFKKVFIFFKCNNEYIIF